MGEAEIPSCGQNLAPSSSSCRYSRWKISPIVTNLRNVSACRRSSLARPELWQSADLSDWRRSHHRLIQGIDQPESIPGAGHGDIEQTPQLFQPCSQLPAAPGAADSDRCRHPVVNTIAGYAYLLAEAGKLVAVALMIGGIRARNTTELSLAVDGQNTHSITDRHDRPISSG